MRLFRGRPPNVEKLERSGDLSGLLRALRYEDPVTDREGRFGDLGGGVRAQAVAALARIDDPLAVDGLVRALGDPEDIVRRAAVRGLRDRGGPVALDALLTVATTWTDAAHAQGREEAIDALVAMGDGALAGRASELLLARASAPDPIDVEMFGRLARAAGDDALHATIADLVTHLREASSPERARTLLVALHPESLAPLIDSLHEGRARHEAAFALGLTYDSRAVEPLCAVALGDGDPRVRSAAAWALGAIRDSAAVETLLVATRDSEYAVRTEAIEAFDKLGNAAVAVAAAALVRPSLEAAAGEPAKPAVGPGDGAEPAAELDSEAHAALAARTAPMLRRLLGR